jgi:hypothetical protein
MTKYAVRTLTLALTLAALTASTGNAFALSTSKPSIVTGTDPFPDYVGIVLALLHLA